MASTSQTTNYDLPIYSDSDRADWTDFNTPFQNIDTALKTAYDNAANASSGVTSLTSDLADVVSDVADNTATLNTLTGTTIPALNTDVGDLATSLSSVTTRVDTAEDDIDALETDVASLETALNNIWDTIYPVGAVYLSYTSTSPADLFGGTWEQITNGYLRAGTSASNYTSGSNTVTGSHTLTVSQIPSHGHSTLNYGVIVSQGGIQTGSGYTTGSENFGYQPGSAFTIGNTGGGSGHTHPIDLNYLQVFVWHRTA